MCPAGWWKMHIACLPACLSLAENKFFNVISFTGWGISRLTPLWGIHRLTPLHPTNGMLYAPGSQYIVVGGKAVQNAWNGCHGRHLEGRQQVVRGIKGVLTDLCLSLYIPNTVSSWHSPTSYSSPTIQPPLL